MINAESFLKDVASHKMVVCSGGGPLYRHLKFKRSEPNSWNQWFELVTWPGALAISGDMGSFIFRRVDDMFSFFRRSELGINESYWSEKCEAVDRNTPIKVFDPAKYRECITSSVDNYDLDEQRKRDILEDLQLEVFNQEDQRDAYQALCNFEHDGFSFSDAWEIRGEVYSGRFLWCLYAIVWGIQRWDAATPAPEPVCCSTSVE